MISRKDNIALKILLSGASLWLAASAISFATAAQHLPFGAWRRASETPILSPEGAGWESAGTFNPAVVVVHVPRRWVDPFDGI